ncbi:hypothetical protein QYE76_036358 [Lolium multiflorum]|uniref:Retrotransposon gag domain-containing protein n=1 Tax=Lolium multiflorum TaxID=4521 RepID=A0AAD8R2A0_LOLMU|nr:hypothetical protein QYE76_036358 [Lolium multiflorum]
MEKKDGQERERVDHLLVARGSERGNGGHGGTPRGCSSARPGQATAAPQHQHHHGKARRRHGIWSVGGDEIATALHARRPEAKRTSRGGGETQIEAEDLKRRIKRRRASHEEEQLDMKTDVKMDVKLDMELDMKIFHGRAREEREACERRSRRPGWSSPNNNKTMTKILSLKMTHTMLIVRLVVIVLVVGIHLAAMVVDKMKKMDWVSPSFPYPSLKEELMLKNTSLGSSRLRSYGAYIQTTLKKIKLASSEFDGYALRWWDSFVRNRNDDGAQPIRTWRAMKEAMTSRFVPTNYLRNIFDKLTLLRQGVKTVDEYYMEMEMLMQRGRVHESLEMTMQRFLNGLKYDVKGSYTNMNQLLHHAREVESQLAEEAKVKGRATGAGRFTPRALYAGAFDALRSLLYSA